MKERPGWLDGPIVIAGNWEPLVFRRRCGGGTVDLADRYAAEHTPVLADRLAEAGVTLLITHWFKGFGLQSEAADMDAARRLIRLCHERDIRVGGYVGDTFVHDTMLLEEPEAEDWCQRKTDGTPVTYGGSQTWRWKWCRNNPAFTAYMKRVLTLGIEAGLDMIHFDNFLNKPEPKTCRCRHCVAQFREFLEGKYTPKQRHERLGFSDVTRLEPPWSTTQLYSVLGVDVFNDPVWQEWIDFRCESLARCYGELAGFCRSLKPDSVIECNPTGIWGENSAHMRSVDHARLLPHGDFFWDESPNPHGQLANGALSTHLRSMKLGEATGNRTFFYSFASTERAAALRMGEALAANDGCLGMITWLDGDRLPSADLCRPFVEFLQKHRDLLCGTSSLARVAVYRQFATLAWDAWTPHLQTLLAEQVLIEGQIPFDFIFDLEAAEGYPVLVVAGMECLSDTEIASVQRLADANTTVLAVGDVGCCDEWRRRRPSVPLQDDANIVQVPALELPTHAPAKKEREIWDDYYRVVDARFWQRPGNSEVLLRHVPRPFTVEAQPGVLALPRLAADGRTILIHCLDYDLERPMPAEVTIRLPAPAETIRLLAPGCPDQELPRGDVLTVSLDAPYRLVTVGPADGVEWR